MRCHFSDCRLHRLLVFVQVLLLLVPVGVVHAQGQQRASRMRETASRWLSGSADFVEDLLPGEDFDSALLDPVGGGMRDLEQTLGEAVFAVPVAGNIGYVLRPQIYHDLPIIFPPNWNPVSVIIADQARWQHGRQGSVILIQPGEVGARTNMTLVFDTGELLQLDLEEVTGAFGRSRTGRVYIGPQGWLVERVFALMPGDVRDRIVVLIQGGEVKVSQLLSDPIAVIREHGNFDALPPADDDRWRRVREQAQVVARMQRDLPGGPPPAPEPEVVAEAPVERPPPPVPEARIIPMPTLDQRVAPGEAVDGTTVDVSPDALRPGGPLPPGLRRDDGVSGPFPLPFGPGALPDVGPRVPRGRFPDIILPDDDGGVPPVGPPPGGAVPLPPHFDPSASAGAAVVESGWTAGGARLMTASLLPGDTLPADFFLPGPGAQRSDAFLPAGSDEPRQRQAPGGITRRELPPVGGAPRFVSAEAVEALDEQLTAVQSRLDYARRSAGDRLAERTLEIDSTIEDLRVNYPARVHFSLLLEPDIPPYTAPFYYLGAWHDGDYTYWRLLENDVSFVNMADGSPIQAVMLDDYLYRLPGVVDHGAVVLRKDPQNPLYLFWRRRRELEGP